jgi:hypothetical protein
MAIPLRLEFVGALYHVTSRGDRQDDIYQNNAVPDEVIATIYASGGCALKEVGDYFGLHYATVSLLARNTRSKT